MDSRILLILLSSDAVIHFAATDREFIYMNFHKDWTGARSYCRDKYTDLVTVYNEEENKKLMELARDGGCMWIGLRFSSNAWNWLNPGDSNAYSNWESDTPLMSTTSYCGCLKDSTGKWTKLRCHDNKRFFCYMDGSQNGTVTPTDVTSTASIATTHAIAIAVEDAPAKVDVRKQTVLKMTLRSQADVNREESLQQILEQMKTRLRAQGAANFTLKWRATRKIANP